MLPSAAMGRDIHLWTYGHFGMPIVAFPTAAGFAHEWQSQGMVEALTPLLAAGRIKLYCPESNVAEAWTRDGDPRWRMARHAAYERFVLETLVPFVHEDCRTDRIQIAAAGASLGGLYAALFALKHPEIFSWSLSMSGRYEVRGFTGGYDGPDVYFHNPLAFVPNLSGEPLERIRRNTHLTLVCGQGKWEEGCIEETVALGGWLARKGIPHDRDLWGSDVSHDWVWWRRQALFHVGKRFGG
jgi:esterase/lipase superfamily enzyme